MKLKRSLTCLFFTITMLFSQIGYAASIAGVFGPKVNPEDRSMQYRFAFSPSDSDDGVPRQIRHRIHYQQAFYNDFRWRVVAQVGNTGEEMRFENVAAELVWHFKKANQDNWDSAVRFDFRNARGGRQIYGFNWTNEWKLNDKWATRALALFAWQSGNNANSGTIVSTRFNALYSLEGGHKVGVEMFNSYGRFGDTGSFDDQAHQIGPVYSGKYAGYNYQFGYLNGISDGASDHDFRFWIGKSF